MISKFFACFFKTNVSHSNILIYRLGSLGDSIMALPVFHAIRKKFPSAHITLLTNKPVSLKAAPSTLVLGNIGLYNDAILYPIGLRNPYALFKIILELRRRQLHRVINLNPFRSKLSTFRDKLLFFLAGARIFNGFESDTNLLPPSTSNYHEEEWEASRLARRLESIAPINLDDDSYWDLHLSDREKKEANHLLVPIQNKDHLMALSIGTKVSAKHWGHDNWIKLCSRLALKLDGWSIVFLGSADEHSESAACMNAWAKDSINLCGVSSPRVSAAILEQCRFFVGHDSGPMHLASCVGIPCVAIFAARSKPRQWFPRGNKNRILYHHTDCAGCGLDICIDQKKKCLTNISIQSVENEICELLNIN
jgi:ADP-heptose:LPS heptosyltransferase